MLMASIYGLANDKCNDFKATAARIAYIERISNDTAEQCGQRPDEGTLPNIFYPSMDHTSITELVHYRIGSGAASRSVDVSSYAELLDYVQKGWGRESAYSNSCEENGSRKLC